MTGQTTPDLTITHGSPIDIRCDAASQGVILLHGTGGVTVFLDDEVAHAGLPPYGAPYLDSPLGRAVTIARLRALADLLEQRDPA